MTRSNRAFAVTAGLALVSAAALADPANAPYDNRHGNSGDPDFADVVRVERVRRQVRVSEPVRECWQEERQASEGPFSYNHVGGTLLGGTIGTVVGNQIGGSQPQTYERCKTRYRDSFVERVDGYDVTPADG